MDAFKVVVFLALCLVQSSIQEETSLRKKFTVQRLTSVKDADGALVALAVLNLAVAGDFNRTTDYNILTNFVHDKLALFQAQPEDSLQEVYQGNKHIPLVYNMSVNELVTRSYPKPTKNIGIQFNIEVYKKRCHTEEALFAVKSSF